VCVPEPLVILYQTTRRHISEGGNFTVTSLRSLDVAYRSFRRVRFSTFLYLWLSFLKDLN